MKNKEIQALVIEAQNGSTKAFGKIYSVLFPIMKSKVNSMLYGSREAQAIDDIVQESMVKAFENINNYKPTYNFSSWVGRIVTNYLIDMKRKGTKYPVQSIQSSLNSNDEGGSDTMESFIAETEVSIEGKIIQEETVQEIRGIVADALNDDLHTIYDMRYNREMAYDEIADELGLKMNNIKAKIHRLHSRLEKSELATINA